MKRQWRRINTSTSVRFSTTSRWITLANILGCSRFNAAVLMNLSGALFQTLTNITMWSFWNMCSNSNIGRSKYPKQKVPTLLLASARTIQGLPRRPHPNSTDLAHFNVFFSIPIFKKELEYRNAIILQIWFMLSGCIRAKKLSRFSCEHQF